MQKSVKMSVLLYQENHKNIFIKYIGYDVAVKNWIY